MFWRYDTFMCSSSANGFHEARLIDQFDLTCFVERFTLSNFVLKEQLSAFGVKNRDFATLFSVDTTSKIRFFVIYHVELQPLCQGLNLIQPNFELWPRFFPSFCFSFFGGDRTQFIHLSTWGLTNWTIGTSRTKTSANVVRANIRDNFWLWYKAQKNPSELFTCKHFNWCDKEAGQTQRVHSVRLDS
jgi:hypothetical protein